MARNPFPNNVSQLVDLRAAIEKFILPGFVPPRPIFSASARVFSLGSCFAGNIHEALKRAGIQSTHLFLHEVLNSPAYSLMLVDALRGKQREQLSGDIKEYTLNEKVVAPLRAMLPSATTFILTVGLALSPFVGGQPASEITKSNVKDITWRMHSVDELTKYIRAIIDGLRELRPGIPIFLTLSPIPLISSPNHPSVFVQDCLSKSRLRVALDAVIEQAIPNVFYWPSFEIVRWLGGHVGPFYRDDIRHVTDPVLDLITGLFIDHFFERPVRATSDVVSI